MQGEDNSHPPVKANSNLAFSTYSSPSVINSEASGGLTALGTDMKLVLLCVLFVQVNLTLLMAEEDRRPSATQRSSGQPDVWNPEKPRTIFARRGLTEFQRSQAMRPFGDRALKAPRCSRVKENCVPDSHSRCCDPCSSCHCCFFNTTCRCWRLGHQCQRKT